MASTTELILRFTGDQRQLKETIAAVRADLSRLSTGQTAAVREAGRQTVIETTRAEQRRVAETIKSANQRLKEEQRAAKEVARIVAETARQADRQEALRERAAKRLADAQIREARRSAKELEKSLASGIGGGDISGAISSFGSAVPVLGRLTSQFSNVSTAAAGAGGAIAAAAVPIGLLVAGATAGVAVLTLLGKALFDAAKEAAAFQGKFADLSQQVGVSVETLSTLDVIASTTGGNIETVTASLGIFQKGLENAHDPTSKEAKLLKELGVTSLETETALRQTLAGLFRMGEGAKQTDAVLQLFGRSGRFVNAILKESKGDLDAATKQFSAMGLVVSTQAARAADQFNDSLEILNRQFSVITRTLVSDTIPVFIVLFEELSKGLTGNANAWQSWGKVIEVEIAGIIGIFKTLVQFVASRGSIDFEAALTANIQGILAAAEKVRNKIAFEADVERLQRLTRSILAGRPGDTPDADKANSEAQARAAKSIQLQQKALEESTRVHREALERERDKDLKSIDEWENASKDALLKHQTDQGKIFDEEAANIRRFIKSKEDQLLAEIELLQKRTKLARDTEAAILKIEDEAQKKRDQAELNLNQQLVKTRDAQRAQELQNIKSDLDQGLTVESGAILRRMALLKQDFEDRNVLRTIELDQLTTSAARKIELDNEKIESEIKYTTEFKRLSQERIAAMVNEGAAAGAVPRPGGPITLTPQEEAGNILTPWQQFGIAMPNIFDTVIKDGIDPFKAALTSLKEIGADAMFSLAQGVGAVVQSWVLMGSQADINMRKAVAAVLAGVSAQAAVQAVYELALGIAALTPWGAVIYGPAVAHFKAAALLGSIALGAGALGRLTAGSAFQSNTAGGGGAGSSTTSSPRSGPTQPTPFEADRRTQNQQAITLNVNVKRDQGSIVEVVLDDHRNNGPIRQMILSEGR